MSRFYGIIGYAETKETAPGVWTEIITERNYYGDVLKNTGQWATAETLNDNLNVSNLISILADPYAYQNFHAIRFISWWGAKWKVTKVEVQRPRLILTIGGVYNGDAA